MELVERLLADEHQVHSVTGVVVLIVGFELVVDAVYLEGLQVTDQESVDDRSRSSDVRFLELVRGYRLIRDVHLVLAVDGLHLAVHCLWVEERLLEELREDVGGLGELFLIDIEVEICVIFSGSSIGITSIILQEFLIVILLRILLGTQEKHVLTEMGHSVKLLSFVIWVIGIV